MKWLKIGLIVLGLIIILFLFLIWTAVNGGFSGAINNLIPAPNPTSAEVTKKRDGVVQNINLLFANIGKFNNLGEFATSTHDHCWQGQHALEMNDPYAYRCAYRITKYYGFDSDFKPTMLDLDTYVKKQGWQRDSSYYADTMEETLSNFEKDYGKKSRKYPNGFYVSYLETPQYNLNELFMKFEYAEKDKKDLFQMEYAQNITGDYGDRMYEVKNFQNMNEVFDKITAEKKYILIISIQSDYYKSGI